MYQIFIKLDAPFVWMALVMRMLVLIDADGLTKGRGLNFQHLGRGAGQVWQVELQVLCQIHFRGDEMSNIFTTADHLMTRDPDEGPRFLFLADSIRLKSIHPRMCYSILMGILNRVGTLGLTGKEARVEDEIYIVNVYLTKSGNLKVSPHLLIINQNVKMCAIKGGAEAEAGRHEGTGCGENLDNFQRLKFHFLGESLPAHARPQHRAGPHQHQGLHSLNIH